MSQTFIGSAGSHTFVGDTGTNTLDYSAAHAPIVVDLANDTAQNGFGGTDTVGNIQIVIGSTHGGSFSAGSGSETFVVRGGDNTISGTPPTISEFPVLPTPNAEPFIITTGPDGNVWFSEFNVNIIGRMGLDGTLTEFPTPTSVPPAPNAPDNTGGLAFDADGNVWFTEVGNDKIGVMSPSGVLLHEYAIPIPATDPPTFSLTHRITVGPDGNFWFAEVGTDKIGRITPDGTITEFSLPTASTRGDSTDISAGSQPFDIITGPDGALWFTEFTGDKIGRITTDGVITEFDVPRNTSTVPGFPHLGDPVSLVFGSDGAIWYSDLDGNAIGRMTTDGQVTEYQVPTPLSQPQDLVVGPDGAIWFAEQNSGKIGRIALDGQITEYAIPGPNGPGAFDFGITVGPDGNLWFTEIVGHRIGRITTGSDLTVDYSNAPSAVTVNLETGIAQNGFGGTDTLSDIQNIIGSAGNDTFISGGSNNVDDGSVSLTGGHGADSFVFTGDAFTQGQSGLFNQVTDYTLADGDQVDITALVSAAYAHGSGQPVDSLVQVVEDAGGTFARLQVDPDGAANGANFATIAKLDGVQPGDPIHIVLDATQPAGISIATAGRAPLNDFDGDGTSDILWHSNGAGVTLWLLDNNGQVNSTVSLPNASADWHILGTGDFDGNGASDLLWHNDDGQNFVELLSGGSFQTGVELPQTTDGSTVFAMGDFNGDGTTDILWHSPNDQNSIELMSGGNVQSTVQLPGTTADWQVLGTGDFNGDGTADILWHDTDGQNFVELINNGKFTSGVGLPLTTSDWKVVGTGDFNGDGTSDILWHDDDGRNFIELISDGHFQSGVALSPTTSEWSITDVGDYNGDGTADILWHNTDGQNLVELFNNAHFQSGVTIADTTPDMHVVSHPGELL